MAILKHIASKNADYGEALRYLMFQYDEYSGKPIVDASGRLIPREDYYIDGIHCDPFTFDLECKELNSQYRKNQTYKEIKSHHYILSFDPKDTKNGLTGENAQQLGLEYAHQNFPGHQTLVCTHTDGSNKSGNIHVHIIINSLRKFDVKRSPFMERPCDSRAGYKHHLSKNYLIYLKGSLMEICSREKLHQVDLLSSAEKKISDREYHAKRRGQRNMNMRNNNMLSEGIPPCKTVFQTQKEFLRIAIEEAAAAAQNLKQFQKLLYEKHHITLKISRGRFSYLHPDRPTAITGRSLGTHYDEKYLLSLFKQELPSFISIRSHLRLVVDLQQCIKAQQNQSYAMKVKLSNLQQMAKTVAYVQENGYDTREDLQNSFSKIQVQTAEMRNALRSTEQKIKAINTQIHYTGQYLANKAIYSQFIHTKNKKHFRQEHQTEITLYETARKILLKQINNKPLPSIKALKTEKEKLINLKKNQYESYQKSRRYEKELKIICTNVDMILGKEQPHPKKTSTLQL